VHSTLWAGDCSGERVGWRMKMSVTATTRQEGDVTIVDLDGRIALGEESAKVRELIMSLLSEGHTKILLNMAGVDYIDSSGLGALVSSVSSVRRAGGEMKLASLSNKVDDLMEVTRLYTVFDITDDEEAALQSFNKSAAAGA
jgi:anti-sigma B factor antagonist